MSATTSSSIASRRERREPHRQELRVRPTGMGHTDHRPVPSLHRHGRGGRVLFEIPFRSEMSDSDLARLARVLDLSTHMQPKMRPDPNSPGVTRLDHYSGLYLERGCKEGQWVLEARTWGKSAPESVHEWQLLAALAARELDPGVRLPERRSGVAAEIPDRRVGSRSGKHFGFLRRHLVGLP